MDTNNDEQPPKLVILVEPVQTFRFRYDSEKNQRHGSLKGFNGECITVELQNYTRSPNEQILIHCYLVQPDNYMPHQNRLLQRCKNYVDNLLNEDNIFKLKDISIIKPKVNSQPSSSSGSSCSTSTETEVQENPENQRKKQRKSENWKNVCICFEAYSQMKNSTSSNKTEICKVYSKEIQHCGTIPKEMKKFMKLNISYYMKENGTVNGGEQMVIVSKQSVEDQIKVQFFDNNGWISNVLDINYPCHHTISLITPKYKDLNIKEPVSIQFKLFREGNELDKADTKEFTYLPDSNILNHQRRADSSDSTDVLDQIMQQFTPLEIQKLKTSDGLLAALNSGDIFVTDGGGGSRHSIQYQPNTNLHSINELNILKKLKEKNVLHKMIEENRMEELQCVFKIIEKYNLKKILNLQNEYGDTCLHSACIYDQSYLIKSLIDLGINYNIQNDEGNTPLHIAVIKNHIVCVKKLLSAIAVNKIQHNGNIFNYHGYTPLHLAIQNNNLQMVKILVENDQTSITIKFKTTGNNILHLAATIQENEEIMEFLLNLPGIEAIKYHENYADTTAFELASLHNAANNILQLF